MLAYSEEHRFWDQLALFRKKKINVIYIRHKKTKQKQHAKYLVQELTTEKKKKMLYSYSLLVFFLYK